jgi:drug/metabolite transporter (DMT)-like permease
LIPIVPNVLFQLCWTLTFYYKIQPALGMLIGNTQVFFAVALSFLIYPDERRLGRRPQFWFGLLAGMVGVTGLVAARDPAALRDLSVGLIFVMASALMWAVYSLTIRAATRHYNARTCFAVVSLLTTLALGAVAVVAGAPLSALSASWPALLALFGSGALCIGLGHTLYYRAVQIAGVSVASVFIQCEVLVTFVASWLVFGEALTGPQLAFAAVLLIGCVVTALVRNPPNHVVSSPDNEK